MSQSTLNIKQNSVDFKLEPLNQQAPLFKYKYLEKTLDPAKPNPEKLENYRTVTIKCLVKGCTKKWINQKVNAPTSNYYSHFRFVYKAINIKGLRNDINPRSIILDSTAESSSQLSLKQSFNKRQKIDESKEEEEVQTFIISHFKKLLLNFIVSNNISFRAVTTPSFRRLLAYLHRLVFTAF
ncbi:hypothetical protein DL95DRAFT_105316 [Leptodontidium sp. 2 PMI_412]|nr:hypothetical protein DL95DRAFT_105316 [Leptodontidium sp. 2 PMI_412]